MSKVINMNLNKSRNNGKIEKNSNEVKISISDYEGETKNSVDSMHRKEKKKKENEENKKNEDKTYKARKEINEERIEDKKLNPQDSKNSLNLKLIIIIPSIILACLVGFGIYELCIYLINKSKNKNKDESGKKEETLDSSEIKKMFEPSFKINSEVNSFNQLLMKSNQKYTTLSNGVDSSYTVFTKTKYDLYTLNESKPAENEDYYSTKYATIVTINSQCTDLSFKSNEEEPDCQLENYLDLSINNKNNLRRDDEDNENIEEKLKKVFIPLCIIEHTDTNIIISITCPETLASNIKDDIKSAFQMMRPNSIKGLVNDDIAGNTIEIKENKKYIKIFSKACDESIFESTNNKNLTCEEEGNIITDSNGNVLSSKYKNTFESLKNENNKYSKILDYSYELLNKKNPEDFDSINYKENYQKYYEIIKNIMKKEDHFTYDVYK